VIYKILAITIPALGLGATIVCGQSQPQTFFKDHVKLTDSQIHQIEQGQIVTKVLESGDPKYGMLVFGAVYLNAPIPKFADAYRDVQKLTENRVYLAVQEFSQGGSPPKLSDFARVELERKDIDELGGCKPGDCDLQVFNVADFQKRVDWKSLPSHKRHG
jgi:hypothetical protein